MPQEHLFHLSVFFFSKLLIVFFLFFIVRVGGSGEGKRLASEDYWNPKVLKVFMIFLFYNEKKKILFWKNLHLTIFTNAQKHNGKRKSMDYYPTFPNITHEGPQKSNT